MGRFDQERKHLCEATEQLQAGAETLDLRLGQLVEITRAHERRHVGTEDQQAVMLTALVRLLERMDAFAQGLQETDGNAQIKT